jgi:RNA polymerase sigma-B factor
LILKKRRERLDQRTGSVVKFQMWPSSAPRLLQHERVGALMANSPLSVVPSHHHTAREELAERTHELLIEAATAGPLRRQQILDEVITSHLWLAEKLARQFLHRGEDEEDLIQVAYTGLVEACIRFDPEQGSFVGFAEPTITGVLKRHFRDHGWTVRPPRPTQELAAVIWRRWPTLVQEMATLPRAKDLAAELGAPVTAVQQARMASEGYSGLSIEAAMSRGVCFCSNESDEDKDRAEARLIIDRAVARLEESERRLIWLRFFEQRSQSDIATELGISQMQVSRLLSRLLLKLRSIIGTSDNLAAAS